jgi:hypothetical protein
MTFLVARERQPEGRAVRTRSAAPSLFGVTLFCTLRDAITLGFRCAKLIQNISPVSRVAQVEWTLPGVLQLPERNAHRL